jgi:hypothetical protein
LAMASSSSNRMSRLGMLLSEYNIHVEHIPGVKKKASDGLSRALDATTNKTDSYKINKDQRVEFLTAPPISSSPPIPLAEFMFHCQQHIQNTWPPHIPELLIEEIRVISEICEALSPPQCPTSEQEATNCRMQPLALRVHQELMNLKCDPDINTMSQAEADKFCSSSPNKSNRIALVAMNETAFTPQAFAALQGTDPDCLEIRNTLDDLPLGKMDQGYFMQDGILMHEYTDQNEVTHSAVCIPRELVPLIMGSYHTTILGGHQGSKKVEKDLKRKFFWKNMKSTVQEASRKCVPCLYNKKYPVGFTQGRLIQPSYPNHIVYMDITGGLPMSYDGCNSILLLYDRFSKFAFSIPLRSEKAPYIAKQFVQQYTQAFGVPFYLHSDCGANLAGSCMTWICRMLGCKKTETPSWCPRADPAECLVGAVGDPISACGQ